MPRTVERSEISMDVIADRAYRSRSASSTGSTRTMFSACTAVRVDVTSTQPKAR
jgi:hypothetical protein